MKINYKKLLEYYYGKHINSFINELGDGVFDINGEKKELIINNWLIESKEIMEFKEIMSSIIEIFDIIYYNTDEINNGTIIDFQFNADVFQVFGKDRQKFFRRSAAG